MPTNDSIFTKKVSHTTLSTEKAVILLPVEKSGRLVTKINSYGKKDVITTVVLSTEPIITDLRSGEDYSTLGSNVVERKDFIILSMFFL